MSMKINDSRFQVMVGLGRGVVSVRSIECLLVRRATLVRFVKRLKVRYLDHKQEM